MKKIFWGLLAGILLNSLYAQSQTEEFNKKIQVDSVKNTVDKENSKESKIEEVEIEEKQELDQNLLVSSIKFIGLKKTKESYIQSKFKKYQGKTLAETDLHELETAVQLEGLFDDIHINTEQISESEAQISISVKEKITFIPLPFAMVSNSGFMAGGIVMDTNAFGCKDMFMVGGFFSGTSKTALASFSKAPKDHGIPGFSIGGSFSKSEPELVDLEENDLFKYKAIAASGTFSLSEKLGEHFMISNGYSFKYISTDYVTEYRDKEPESIKAGAVSLSLGYSDSDWNGFFMSTNSVSVSGEAGLTNSEDSDYRHPLRFSFAIGEQHPILTPRLRMYQKISGFYGKKNHLAEFKGGSAASVNILPDSFMSERIVGGKAGLEFAVKKFSWAMFSLYADYQLVYTKVNTLLPDDDDYKLMQGVNGGFLFYLSKVAFPALGFGLAYNMTQKYWQAALAMGISF